MIAVYFGRGFSCKFERLKPLTSNINKLEDQIRGNRIINVFNKNNSIKKYVQSDDEVPKEQKKILHINVTELDRKYHIVKIQEID